MLFVTVLFVTTTTSIADAADDDATTVDLSVLGTNSWTRFRPGWSLTVNDQCLYEFVFQIEHDSTLPNAGELSYEFARQCRTDLAVDALRKFPPDGKFWVETRQHWEALPPYVQAVIGFHHLSIDWRACGEQPEGYAKPTYEFSFYKPTPEYRAGVMNCTLFTGGGLLPLEPFCDAENQVNNPQGQQFFVIPRAVSNPSKTVNMPEGFTTDFQQSPVRYVGTRQWNPTAPPRFAEDWNDLALQMATYDGDLSMMRVKVPYSAVSNAAFDANDNPAPWDKGDKFHSLHMNYHESTIETLPDTISVDYDHADGFIRLHVIGKAGVCRSEFESLQQSAGGKAFFPDYDELIATDGNSTNGDGDGDGDDGSGVEGMSIMFATLLVAIAAAYP